MEKDFKAAEFLFKKIKAIYPTFEYPDELDVDIWLDVLNGYSQTQILDALKAYRRNTEYNCAPTPANFEKWLKNQEKETPIQNNTEPAVVCFDPASRYMQRDIKIGVCKHLLGDYNRAVRAIVRRLEDYVPITELQKMDFAQKWQNVENKGLNADFDEVLEKVCSGDENIGAVTSSDDFGSVGAILAGHWRA